MLIRNCALLGTFSSRPLSSSTASTGFFELVLAREIADRRVFPAIDIVRSATRKEELLFTTEELNRVYLLRNFLGDMPEAEAIEFLLKQMSRSKNNKEFFQQMVNG